MTNQKENKIMTKTSVQFGIVNVSNNGLTYNSELSRMAKEFTSSNILNNNMRYVPQILEYVKDHNDCDVKQIRQALEKENINTSSAHITQVLNKAISCGIVDWDTVETEYEYVANADELFNKETGEQVEYMITVYDEKGNRYKIENPNYRNCMQDFKHYFIKQVVKTFIVHNKKRIYKYVG